MKFLNSSNLSINFLSPSLGREWIEITVEVYESSQVVSPSLGREWIEMTRLPYLSDS